ncbi:hypothetical protein CLCR_11279 [Cladophialophora carrionii]|uniref:Uncharacterized protein n=1 Tax=Cladophialophora carrionii TaxID=86049 RepID=A0A1C1CHB9_9EURO|nr:hypothetical protein CLCR_11279 [Cladophialophora carrionii]
MIRGKEEAYGGAADDDGNQDLDMVTTGSTQDEQRNLDAWRSNDSGDEVTDPHVRQESFRSEWHFVDLHAYRQHPPLCIPGRGGYLLEWHDFDIVAGSVPGAPVDVRQNQPYEELVNLRFIAIAGLISSQLLPHRITAVFGMPQTRGVRDPGGYGYDSRLTLEDYKGEINVVCWTQRGQSARVGTIKLAGQ